MSFGLAVADLGVNASGRLEGVVAIPHTWFFPFFSQYEPVSFTLRGTGEAGQEGKQ